MANKLMLTFLGCEILFLLSGGLLIGFALFSESSMRSRPTPDTVAPHLLLKRSPLTATIVNAIFIFATFLLALPAIFLPTNRGWLRMHGYMVTFCATFTLVLGLITWIGTLQTRNMLGVIWAAEAPETQSLLQQKFKCCGYANPTSPPFVTDATCTDAVVAANLGGCIGPFSSFANQYLDVIFTAAFGLVGLDTILLLHVAMVLKERSEQARYRHIDEKNGTRM
ncbi:Tetraspanin [Neofusicoccum parvum]|uniref:Tetraspanin n=3 Tax=Neofusicoccum TaxID=407951 RepID=A0ABR3SQY1_9PEZI|nr:putative tetraspanin protein [Neofusicoccum parvum UCRNP2]GME49159.1 Tetraspanin [Neofusicoccum parvum]GME64859.1 Tetraspanin [Neofusicoccum parvum]